MHWLTTSLLAVPLLTAVPAAVHEHVVRIEHPAGPIEARYRGSVEIAHRQTGAVAPGGRAATLRCRWRADLSVTRAAVARTGTMTRTFARRSVLTGSRPGWCDMQRTAIAREVADRAAEIGADLRALAREDHAPLRAELDRQHAAWRVG